jgi:hypothetical protein
MAAQPSRLDLFRNVIADEPYCCYAPVLQLIEGTRMEKRGYENGFLWENGQQQVCAYDKIQKMVRDKLKTSGLPANTIRFEMRLLKSRKVRDVLNVSTARELLDSYDGILEAYEKTMRQQLFRHEVRDVEAMFASDLEKGMAYFKENFGRNWLQKYWQVCGYQFVSEHASKETILAAVSRVESDKSKLSRLRSNLESTRFQNSALFLCGQSKRTTGQLYEEMREKVFNRLAA